MAEQARDNQQETDLSGPFAILLADIERRLDRVERELDEISQRYHDTAEDRSYRAFIDALKLAAQGMGELVRDRESDFLNADHPDGRLYAYQALGANAAIMEDQLEDYLQALGFERPQELEVFAVPLMRLAKQLIPNVELLFFPWTFDGYKTVTYGVEELDSLDPKLAENLQRVFGGDIKFVKLWHPATRAREIFEHPVFAHEIAHTAIEQTVPDGVLAADDRGPPDEAPPTFSTVASGAVELPRDVAHGGDEYDRLLSWFAEIACDIVAMRTIGPAYAVAFADVTSPNRTLEPTKRSGEHPPAEIRFGFLRDELVAFGFDEGDGGFGDLLHRYTRAYPASTGEEEDEIPGAQDWLVQAVAKFHEYLPHLLGTQEYLPETLHGDLELVIALAARGVPPAERIVAVEDPDPTDPPADDEWSRPLDWRSILNSTLLWHLEEHGFPVLEPVAGGAEGSHAAAKRRRERADHRAEAARLAVGGIELSEMQARAHRLSRELGPMRLDDEVQERTKR